MQHPDAEQIKFARALVNPDKAIRDATLETLRKTVSKWKTVSELEMLKLWKSLFYCMWLADMSPVQQELAERMANLINSFHNADMALFYVQMFFRTIVREWHHLDQYRLNKFYSLIKVMLQKIFVYIRDKQWDSALLGRFLAILKSEVLAQVPNGLRYHIADIYLEELWNATNGEVDTDVFLAVLKPFLETLASAEDKSFHARVVKRVFQGFVDHHAAQSQSAPVMGAEEGPKKFLSVSTQRVADAVFDIAADENTREGHRRTVYELHKSFQNLNKSSKKSNKVDIDIQISSPTRAPAAAAAVEKVLVHHAQAPAAATASASATPSAKEGKKDKKRKAEAVAAPEHEHVSFAEPEPAPKAAATPSKGKSKAAASVAPSTPAVAVAVAATPKSSKKTKAPAPLIIEEEEEAPVAVAPKSASKKRRTAVEAPSDNDSEPAAEERHVRFGKKYSKGE